MPRNSLFPILCAISLIVSPAWADLYVLGGSYIANGIDHFPPGPVPESPTGDDLWCDGPVWVAVYAMANGHPVPISSSRTPEVGETGTNFARGGAEIVGSSGTGGVTHPKDAGEQWQECKNYLASNGAPTADDIFVISSFGNAILDLYGTAQSNVVQQGVYIGITELDGLWVESVGNSGDRQGQCQLLPPVPEQGHLRGSRREAEQGQEQDNVIHR